MDRNFLIHIGDLLAGNTLEDTIVFENKQSLRMPESRNGISGSIHIQHGDASTILLELEGFSCEIERNCDVCGSKEYISLHTQPRQTKRMKGVDEDLLTENDYPIKDTSRIDVEEVIIEDLILHIGPRIMCEKCSKHIENIDNDNNKVSANNPIVRK